MKHKHPLDKKPHHEQMEHPLHRMIRDFWGTGLGGFDEFRQPMKVGPSDLQLSEDEHSVYVEASLPGLEESEIDVTLDKGVLWIHGEKKESEDKKKYHFRASRSYSYKLALPDSVDLSSEADASYEKGVLHVTFKKAAGEQAKKICINNNTCCRT